MSFFYIVRVEKEKEEKFIEVNCMFKQWKIETIQIASGGANYL